MSALSRFEQFVEQIMEGSFTRLLRSQLQPVEIAKKLARAMEDSQVIGANGRRIVANRYDVILAPQDFSLFEPYKASLELELAQYVVSTAKERRLYPASHPTVAITSSKKALPKRPIVRATKVDAVDSAEEAATLGGHTSRLRLPLQAAKTAGVRAYLFRRGQANAEPVPVNHLPYSLGRGFDNDLVMEDVRVSRHHARIEELNRRLLLVDLGSTNGTFVNGDRVERCLLNQGDVISLGGLELLVTLEEKD